MPEVPPNLSGLQVIHVMSVEDNDVIRHCLKTFLKNIGGFELIAEAKDAQSALCEINKQCPEVALIDIGLPGMNGIELTKHIKQEYPQIRVLMLTASENAGDIFDSLDAGADGYVLKGDFSTNLEMAIRSVKLGAVWLDPLIARQVLQLTQSSRPASRTLATGLMPMPLSEEEKSVLFGVAESNCKDGVCLVDPSFLEKLKRFSSDQSAPQKGASKTPNRGV